MFVIHAALNLYRMFLIHAARNFGVKESTDKNVLQNVLKMNSRQREIVTKLKTECLKPPHGTANKGNEEKKENF